MLNKELIQNKIENIQNDLVVLGDFSSLTFDDFIKDSRTYYACERILEQIIGRAIDINQHIIVNKANLETRSPLEYRDTFLKLVELDVSLFS